MRQNTSRPESPPGHEVERTRVGVWAEILRLVDRDLGSLPAEIVNWVYLENKTAREVADLAGVDARELGATLNRIYKYVAVIVASEPVESKKTFRSRPLD